MKITRYLDHNVYMYTCKYVCVSMMMVTLHIHRFESIDDYDKVAGSYCVDAALMTKAKKEMIVMHPLPRYIFKYAHSYT